MKNNEKNNDNVDVYEIASGNAKFFGLNDDDEISIRKFMMLKLLQILPELENKILHGRIKDKDAEKIRLDYFKQYINLCNCINNFTKSASYSVEKDLLKGFLDVDVADDFSIIENSDVN